MTAEKQILRLEFNSGFQDWIRVVMLPENEMTNVNNFYTMEILSTSQCTNFIKYLFSFEFQKTIRLDVPETYIRKLEENLASMQKDLNIDRKDYLNIIYKKDNTIKFFFFIMIFVVLCFFWMILSQCISEERGHCKSKAELINASNITVRFK